MKYSIKEDPHFILQLALQMSIPTALIIYVYTTPKEDIQIEAFFISFSLITFILATFDQINNEKPKECFKNWINKK